MPPCRAREVENAGKLTAAACRRATTWRPEIFLRCRGLGRISRRNGCTVRIIQGAWWPFGRSGNHQRKSDARTNIANALPAGRATSRPDGLRHLDYRGRHRSPRGWTTRERKSGKVRLEAARRPHLPRSKNASTPVRRDGRRPLTGIANATVSTPVGCSIVAKPQGRGTLIGIL